jgi:hypothetical protein
MLPTFNVITSPRFKRVRLGTQADRDGLDLFTVADHPYFGDKLDAGPADPCLLWRDEAAFRRQE